MIFSFKTLKYLPFASLLFALTGCEHNEGILNPKGIVTFLERQLLFDTTALMLIVIIPVIIISIDFVYHYREKNHDKQITDRKVEYKPNWSHSRFYEGLWWTIPCLIVLGLAFMSWHFTHKLDPYRKLDYKDETVLVQVVSLPWKWLFIYPQYNIATVNHLVIPNEQQIEFDLTGDNVPMSSFFIPQLGSQIYTMAGMRTKLHLIPVETGQLRGLNAQYNGIGFSEMHFTVDVRDQNSFNAWITEVKNSESTLSTSRYDEIRQPEVGVPPQYFSNVADSLFEKITTAYHYLDHPKEL